MTTSPALPIDPYLRWSDQHQSRGSSLARQRQIVRLFADELGWPFDANSEMIEDGKSAFSGANLEKGKLGDYERAVRRGEKAGRCLMVEKMDRLSRRVGFDALRWFGDMVECGLTIAIADARMVVDRQSIRHHEHQLKAILDEIEKAHAYSATLSKRIRPAWEAMRNGRDIATEHAGTVTALTVVGDVNDVTRIDVVRGRKIDRYWVNDFVKPLQVGAAIEKGQTIGSVRQKVHTESTAPAWLELIENRSAFRIRPEIAAIIVLIFELYANTDLGARGLAKLLNGWDGKVHCKLFAADPFVSYRLGKSVPTLRDGRCWHGSTIKTLLKNRAVIGEYEHAVKREKTGNVVTDYFPAVVSLSLWQSANDKGLARIKSNHSRTSRLRHLLSDIARCNECLGNLTFITKRVTPENRYDTYAQCQSAYLNTGCTSKKSLRMMAVEDTILDNILVLAMDDEHFTDEGAVPELRRIVSERKEDFDAIQRRIETLMDLIEDRTFRRDDRFDLRLRTAQNEEVAALKSFEDAQERFKAAQGAVTPQEHVKRVSDIRADLWSRDEGKGMDARRKVKLALNDLCDVFYWSAEHNKAVLVLKGGVRHLMVDALGNLLANVAVTPSTVRTDDAPAVREYFRRLMEQAA